MGQPILMRTLTDAYEMLAELNPFRYRGYVWDSELNLCYLQNRFYVYVGMDSSMKHI